MAFELRRTIGIALTLVFISGASAQNQVKLVAVKWTPPATTIDKEYVASVQKLLGNGLSDPRGGKFSLVRVKVGDAAWSGVVERDAFGWVMPGGKRVVAVDGLTYPIVKVVRDAKTSELFQKTAESGRSAMREGAVPLSSATIAMPGLLLVRGEVKLAEEFYRPTKNNGWSSQILLFGHLVNRYRMQVAQFLMDRRDQEALPWAKGFAAVSAIRIAAKVNYPDDTVGWKLSDEEGRLILQDVTRRVANPRKPLDVDALAKLDQKARIAILVERLDEVGAKQWGQPGGISWTGEPTVGLLAKEGEAAIPALLEAIEKDERLTRSVSFGRDFFPMRKIQPVRQAALQVLQVIWPSSRAIFEYDQIDVAKLRAAWARASSLSEPERWLNILRDDSAERQAWLTAGEALTNPVRGWRPASPTTPEVLPSAELKGEAIRAKHGRELVDLMGKRAEQMSKQSEKSSSHVFFAAGDAMRLAHFLAKWDLAASVPYLKAASKNVMAIPDMWGEGGMGYFNDHVAGPFATVLADRIKAGDRSAIADFDWLAQRFKPMFSRSSALMRPVWTAVDDKEVQAVGEKFYDRFRKDIRSEERSVRSAALQSLDDLVRSPLILTPGFRKFMAEMIAIDAFAGQGNVEEYNGYVSAKYSLGPDGGSGSRGLGQTKDLDLSKYTRASVPFTVGDYVAECVSGFSSAPRYSLALKPDLREAGRARVREWLLDPKVDWAAVVKALQFYDGS